MTILNVLRSADRVIVAMDTIGMSVEGRPVEQSKFLLLPAANVLVCGRGLLGPAYEVAMNGLMLRWTFDDCKREAPAILETALTALRSGTQTIGVSDELFVGAGRSSVMLAGWSEVAAEMQAVRIYEYEGKARRERLDGAYFVPAVYPEGITVPRTDDDMLRIGKDQAGWMREHHPTICSGGRLLVAELTRGKVTVREVGKLSGTTRQPS